MPILLLIALAVITGTIAGVIARRYPRRRGPSATPALEELPVVEAAASVGATVRRHPSLRHHLSRRLDPDSATGLALTLALAFTIVAGIGLGLLAFLVRTNGTLIELDRGVARWGDRHATSWSTHGLDWVTQLGSITVVIGLSVVVAIVEVLRTRSRWIVPFLVVVIGGEEIFANTIKVIVDRARPAFNPAAATLGPSFPSGHTTTAAAFYAAVALLAGRHRGRAARAVAAGAAVGIAVAVASSRVLLDVHWLTDVIGGLLLGWAWFAICAVAFGGRLLVFGAAAEIAARAAESQPQGASPDSRLRRSSSGSPAR
ncbi:MAG TPA: phosphatase PAP2 family protein [Gaiellaceae bacterium]|jgi:undecaprenyl-diphosphatase|nr:phosphatase PAP2 family protein [Gaiellaceae bacterium]